MRWPQHTKDRLNTYRNSPCGICGYAAKHHVGAVRKPVAPEVSGHIFVTASNKSALEQ